MDAGVERTVLERKRSDGSRGGAGSTAGELEYAAIASALGGLRYGTVTIIVQDGVIVQIDRTEKNRLRRSADAPHSTARAS